MDFITDVIMTRASARSYTGGEIPADHLELIARAGFAAPSAVNIQPWELVLVTDRSKLDALCAALPYAKMLDKAAAAYIVCGNPEKDATFSPKMWMVDCSAMTENILLAAHSLGYGAVWTAVWPDDSRMKPVRAILSIPSSMLPLCVVPVGVISGDKPKAKDKFNRGALHKDTW